jgi:CubicO group peptidase (beta-lactamase class C family)
MFRKQLLITTLGFAITLLSFAQGPVPPSPAPTSQQQDVKSAPTTPATPDEAKQLTKDDVDAWLDGYMPFALGVGDLAGAVVTVVKDGQILTERGYGYADVASKKPVDPKLTLFRPGSVSKLITWTAVMQLVEQGKLDLDKDINGYIDFKVPERNGKPVTLRNIMQHTGGFEEQIKYIITEDPTAPAFDELLKRWTPTRVFDAGTTPAYSNYATSLAGYIVQRVSGESFFDYVEKHVFQPLDMKHSTFRQPLPKDFEQYMATGYVQASGEPHKFEIVGPAPAGALSSPGEDMSHFMIAHLQNGEYNGNRILKEETARIMHDSPLTIFPPSGGQPPLNRMELGFFETNINGREVIAHLGDTDYFHTSLHLMLKENVGFYVSFNSAGKQGAAHHTRVALFQEFADRYFPGPRPTSRVDEATAKKHAEMMSGNWIASRGSQTNFFSVIGLIGQTAVTVGAKGELLIPDMKGLNGAPVKWVEIAPFLWQDEYGHERLAANVVDDKVVRWSVDGESPFTVLDRAPASQNGAWLSPALQISLIVLALTAIFWPVTAIVRRRYGYRLPLVDRELTAYRAGKIGSWLMVLAFAAWIVSIMMMFSDLNRTTAKFDPVLEFDQIFGFIGFIGGFLLILWNLIAVWRGDRRWPAKLWSIVLVLAAFIVLWVAIVFHLVSWGVNY